MTRDGHRKLAIAKRRADGKRMWKARRKACVDTWMQTARVLGPFVSRDLRADTEARFMEAMSKLDWRNYRP